MGRVPEPPYESVLGLTELDEAPVRVAEVRGAPPRIVARADEERNAASLELATGVVQRVYAEGEVILVGRPSREGAGSFVDEQLRRAGSEDRAARPLGLGSAVRRSP